MAKFGLVREDFLGVAVNTSDTNISAAQTWKYGGTTAIAPSRVASTATAPGIIQVSAGTGTNAWLALGNSASESIFTFGSIAYARFRTFADAANITMRVGLGQDISAASFGAHAIYLEYAPGSDATWHVVQRNASTSTDVDTNVVKTAGFETWELIRMEQAQWGLYNVTQAGGRTFVNNLFSANLPDDADLCTFGMHVTATGGGTSNCQIDLVELSTVEIANR